MDVRGTHLQWNSQHKERFGQRITVNQMRLSTIVTTTEMVHGNVSGSRRSQQMQLQVCNCLKIDTKIDNHFLQRVRLLFTMA